MRIVLGLLLGLSLSAQAELSQLDDADLNKVAGCALWPIDPVEPDTDLAERCARIGRLVELHRNQRLEHQQLTPPKTHQAERPGLNPRLNPALADLGMNQSQLDALLNRASDAWYGEHNLSVQDVELLYHLSNLDEWSFQY